MVNLLADRRDEAKSKHLALAFRLVLANPIRDINRAHLDMEYPNTITLEHQYDLEREVSKEELKKAVWDCGNDKSLGPDGFTFGFYRHFWPIIEKDVFEVVKCFFNCGIIPKGCNSSFIALIPKIPDANLVKDFRSISLIGSMYKIIAKILSNRLVGVLGDIINEVQSAFIADRQILDGPFILNEVLKWCKLKRKQSLIFKVDFEKAFDSVRWDFLDEVLKFFGFGDKWCSWIQSCLNSSRGSILINGSPTEEFKFFKGLKQGDPLSPFLFILIMESLHLSFQRVVDVGMFKGIKLNSSTTLSHMFYADDAVFVGQWCDDNINTLIHVLECFYRASGLRINMSKSKIMGVLVEENKVKSAATKLGCLLLNTPFTYLGTKVGGSMARSHAWEEVINKVSYRLSKWKMNTLSIGGRLTLLKSVLGSIPIFHLSIFKAPLTILRKLESIRSHFFNGHELSSKKATWIKWTNVLAPKVKGGLGVTSLFALNRALMLKWVWRFHAQSSSFWARIIKAIHSVEGKIGTNFMACNHSCWLNIVKEISVLKNQGINFMDFMHLKLGNGNNISFWEDHWIGDDKLKTLYPRLYVLENNKYVSVSTKLADVKLDNSFRRMPRGGIEHVQFVELSDRVSNVNLLPRSDRWTWSLEGSGEFTVASIRREIDDKRLSGVTSKTRWIKSVPIKVNVHAWKVKLDVLPTRLNISRLGIVIDSILCPICDNGVESSNHLFFTCDLARQLSRMITQWWDIPQVESNSYDEWWSWLWSLRFSSKYKLILEGIFYVMWWHLWSYRNKLLFEIKNPLKATIFDDIVSRSFYWKDISDALYGDDDDCYDNIKANGENTSQDKVMTISVISISSDSSSMGTPVGRVILFGTIPITIPDTTLVIIPPTTQTDTTVIPTETPIIAPTIPPSPYYTPASPDYSPASDSESDPSKDPLLDHIPPLPATSPFLSSDDDTTNSDSPDTPLSPTHGTPFTEITSSTQRSPVIPHRQVMILAPGQPISHGRPYRYHLNGLVHMMTARKRVGPLPTHRLVVRHSADHSSSDSSSEASSDFHSDASSNSSSRHSLSNHSSPDLPSTFAGPSRKRHRSLMASVPALPLVSRALSPVRADLIPSPKRIRDSGYSADIEVDPRETSLRDDVIVRGNEEPHLEQDIDPEIQAEIDECFAYADALRDKRIDARVVVEAVDREESETGARGPEGAVKVTYETLGDLVQRFHDHIEAILVDRIQVIEGVQREQGHRIVGVESAVAVLTERITELERDNKRLRGTASVESQRVDRLQRDMSHM
ncbi:RNA-directed DNA polymerase, eukaryota, reverse transcriptase zinc-binding domain protein [Tanacetum coccineum]|uniref:RNA-directed DNA polymerase, eukaryota, reverse transcriptase zinc-binding domain protein n=1 Tax=Tanacetum coccineum TaxID=301880 RepID=A0ABQ5G5P1_9ASTR